jgi:aerobic carbon-monoxide dehydrogenase medium subunit
MIPGTFAYHAPTGLDDALDLLQQHGDDAKIMAGGQSLIPLMKFRLAQPEHLIDINRIANLATIDISDGWLRIGALTRESALERMPDVRSSFPLLLETTQMIADPLVRNLATVGGNIAHADPANDHPATMLAYRAIVVAVGPSGERTIPIDDFFVGTFETALQPDEILTEIRIPAPEPRSGGAYVKFERKVGDYAVSAAAAQLTLDAEGRIARAGLALTNASYVSARSTRAEAFLLNSPPTPDVLREAASLAAADSSPVADLRGSADYKRSMARTTATRALRLAAERAGFSTATNGGTQA